MNRAFMEVLVRIQHLISIGARVPKGFPAFVAKSLSIRAPHCLAKTAARVPSRYVYFCFVVLVAQIVCAEERRCLPLLNGATLNKQVAQNWSEGHPYYDHRNSQFSDVKISAGQMENPNKTMMIICPFQ